MKLTTRLKWLWYDVKYGIENIIRWFPVIWKLRDWDFQYVYILIEKQLWNMEKCFIDGCAIHSKKEMNKIKTARILSKRLYEDGYLANALIPVEDKYSESKISFQKTEVVIDDAEKHKKARSRAYKHSDNMRIQDKEMLFNILNKYIESWWD